jgi:hypothetical protein
LSINKRYFAAGTYIENMLSVQKNGRFAVYKFTKEAMRAKY